MKLNPLISVIVNCHNGEKYLIECINSILNQSYKNLEIIFWDNCSTDDSKKIIDRFKDKRIKKFKSKKFVKLYNARNLAIKKSKGKYIAFLDTDDTWKNNKLFEQIKVLKKNNKVKIIFSNYHLKNEKKNLNYLKYKKHLPSGYITQNLLDDYSIGILTVLIKKEIFKNTRFNTSYDVIGDFDFFINASLKHEIYSIQKSLATYRVHYDNLSSKKIDVYLFEIRNWVKKNLKKQNLKKYNFKNIKKLIIKLKIKYLFLKFFKINLGV